MDYINKVYQRNKRVLIGLSYICYPCIGRCFGTSVAHDLHHNKFNGNYGFYFLFWDRPMGRLREDYDNAIFTNTYLEKTIEQWQMI